MERLLLTGCHGCLQERILAAGALMVLHLGAFFQADDVIMREIPGSHPYLTGLGILGGMYSFDNPLQGMH